MDGNVINTILQPKKQNEILNFLEGVMVFLLGNIQLTNYFNQMLEGF
jgi:hypothetical protein